MQNLCCIWTTDTNFFDGNRLSQTLSIDENMKDAWKRGNHRLVKELRRKKALFLLKRQPKSNRSHLQTGFIDCFKMMVKLASFWSMLRSYVELFVFRCLVLNMMIFNSCGS